MSQDLSELVDDYVDVDEYIPAEILLDDDHPSQDKFTQDVRHIQQKIFAFSRALKPKKRELARLIRTEMTPEKIGQKLGVATSTIYRWAVQPDVIRLTVLMDHLQQKLDGPELEHRKGVLWRICLDNELKRPNISVQALQEINKMSGTYTDAGNGGNQGNVVNIQINGELMPRGALDTMPETYETQQENGVYTPPTPLPPITPNP